MSYTYTQNTTELQKAADAGLALYETEGVIHSDGAGTITGLEIDNTPTEGSNNLVKSGGIFSAIKTVSDNAAPIITDTASGAIASFPDGADSIPVESLISYINPVQDLHGQSNPYPPGGGKNKLPMTVAKAKADNTLGTWNNNTYTYTGVSFELLLDSGSNVIGVKVTGTATADTDFQFTGLDSYLVAETAYAVNGCPSGGSTSTYFSFVRYGSFDTGSGATVTLTSAQLSTAFFKITIKSGYAISGSLTFKPMVRLSTEADATFAPYSNECPISGYTEMNITRDGVNLWDEEWEVGGISDATGNKYTDNTTIRTKNRIRVNPSTSYYVKSPSNIRRFFYDKYGNYLSASGWGSNNAFTTNASTYYVAFVVISTYGTTYNNDISLNYPSTDTSYHAYNGEVYNISWSDDAGTVYFATLKYLGNSTWKLTVTHAEDDLGNHTWYFINNLWYTGLNDFKLFETYGNLTFGHGICEMYNMYVGNDFGTNNPYTFSIFFNSGNNTSRLWIVDPNAYSMSSADFQTYVTGTKLLYELATPIEYTLTGPDPETLFGQNNWFNDTNGNIDIEYNADTKLFILKAIGA